MFRPHPRTLAEKGPSSTTQFGDPRGVRPGTGQLVDDLSLVAEGEPGLGERGPEPAAAEPFQTLPVLRPHRLTRVKGEPRYLTPATLRTRLFERASDFLAIGTFDSLYVRGYGIPDAALAALEATGASDAGQTVGSPLLDQNAPNPFRPATTIAYTVPRGGNVQLDVFDVSGRLVRELVRGTQAAGHHQVIWNGRDLAGRRVVSGLYFYRLVTGDVTETRRMVFVP